MALHHENPLRSLRSGGVVLISDFAAYRLSSPELTMAIYARAVRR